MQPASTPPGAARSLLAGLAAGAVAGFVAALAASALPSPDHAWLNSLSVALLTLGAGVLSGLLYALTARQQRRTPIYGSMLAAVFVLVALAALLVEALPGHPLAHVAGYCIPLAAIALTLVGVLTPLWARLQPRLLVVAPPLAVLALAGAFVLNARTAPSGHLALPQSASAGAEAPAGGVLRLADVQGLTFVVDSSQSKATYSVQERLTTLPAPDDAVGTTNQVSGTIYLDGRPSTISVDMRSFKSDDRGRDSHLLRDPGLANYAPALFTVSQIDLPSTYTPGTTVTMNVPGMMTIHNVQKPVTFAVDARYQDKTLFIHGQTSFTFQDFNITPPTFQQVLQIDNTIHAEVLLIAKAQS